jgi:hypothetical protein
MAWAPSPKEIASVERLRGAGRYAYLVKHAVDTHALWSLRDPTGWALVADGDAKVAAPVWPHSEYARRCAKGEWDDCEPTAVPLDQWLNAWTEGLLRDQRLVAVFPTPAGEGVIVSPHEFAADLRREATRYAR